MSWSLLSHLAWWIFTLPDTVSKGDLYVKFSVALEIGWLVHHFGSDCTSTSIEWIAMMFNSWLELVTSGMVGRRISTEAYPSIATVSLKASRSEVYSLHILAGFH